jgi:DNA-binding transcriptional MocR family regulator
VKMPPGPLPPATRLPPVRELAAALEVSPATVLPDAQAARLRRCRTRDVGRRARLCGCAASPSYRPGLATWRGERVYAERRRALVPALAARGIEAAGDSGLGCGYRWWRRRQRSGSFSRGAGR